jgi:hypothetical protein
VDSLERRGVLVRSEMQQMPTPGLTEKAALLERYSNSISTNASRPGGSDLNILVASLYCQKSTFIFVHVEVQRLRSWVGHFTNKTNAGVPRAF